MQSQAPMLHGLKPSRHQAAIPTHSTSPRPHTHSQSISPSKNVSRVEQARAFALSRDLVTRISRAKWGPACMGGPGTAISGTPTEPRVDSRRPWTDRFAC